jgi:hypothetical protein
MKLFELTEGAMTRLILSLVLASSIAVTATTAMARIRHRGAHAMYAAATYLYNRCDPNAVLAAGYAGYNPCNDPNAVFVAGTYAGSDPDPNIRAALIREFGRRGGRGH